MKKIILTFILFIPSFLFSQVYRPPGYGMGAGLEGNSFSIDMGIKSIDGDYYVTLNPILEIPFFGLRVGLQIPLEILVYDREPKIAQKTPSIRAGTYNDQEDYFKIIRYISYGTHLYFDPDDTFNWSLFYGIMSDGYIGHRTIINRYISTYNPAVWSPGLMFDINNNWGGVELFANNVLRKEVRGYRVYVRPVGIYTSIWNIANNDYITNKQIAQSIRENKDPLYNRNYLFQTTVPNPGRGGSLRQHLLKPLKEDLQEETIEFREVYDPGTGEVKIVPFPKEELNQPNVIDNNQQNQQNQQKDNKYDQQDKPISSQDDDTSFKPKKHGFWNRWAIGYTVVTDYGAPLSLELDGSSNLVIDPETQLPRADQSENFTVTGVDMELRLSPFRWLDVTPYIDLNKFKNIDKSRGTHVGINFEMKLTNLIKWSLRPEYREITSNYIPEYFDSVYAIERTQYIQTGNNTYYTPKLAYLKSLPTDGSITKGYFINSLLEFTSFFIMEFSYEDYAGPNNSRVFLGFFIPNIGGFFVNGYYYKKDFNKFSEAFVPKSENALLAAEVGISFYGGFYIKYTIKRTWILNEETGEYGPNDEKTIGFGFGSAF